MPGEMGLYDYIQIIRKRRLIILVVFLGIAFINFNYLRTRPKLYRVVATVKVTERKTLGGLLTEWITATPGDPMASQARVAESYPVVERAVRKLELVKEDATAEEVSDMVYEIQGTLSTDIEGDTNIISISYMDSDPRAAARIVNAIAESYIEENLLEKNKEARRVKEFIQEQLKDLKVKLESSEFSLKEFKESDQATGVAIPLQNRLADLETEKAKLLRIYTEKHPNVLRIQEEEDLLRKQIKSIPEKEFQYARLMREFEINEKTYKNLQEKFEEARIAEIEKASDVALVDPASIPELPISQKALSLPLGIVAAFILSLTVGFVVEQLDTSIGTIEGIENYVKLPVLGIIPYLHLEGEKVKFTDRIWHRAKNKREDGIKRIQSQLLIHYPANSSIIEAYKILRTNIQMEIFKGSMQNKIILITSAGPEEGKSITCANLAIAMAQAGNRVLLIDADLRKSSVYKIFGFSRKDTGLTDFLSSTAKTEPNIKTFSDLIMGSLGVDKTISFIGIDNLNILLAGTIPNLPSELLNSSELDGLLQTLKSNYDIILVDSSPVLAVADPVILASRADAVILVYKVGKTARNEIMRTKLQLEAVDSPCKGIILNNISRQVEMHPTYHYKYYGEEKEHA